MHDHSEKSKQYAFQYVKVKANAGKEKLQNHNIY